MSSGKEIELFIWIKCQESFIFRVEKEIITLSDHEAENGERVKEENKKRQHNFEKIAKKSDSEFR